MGKSSASPHVSLHGTERFYAVRREGKGAFSWRSAAGAALWFALILVTLLPLPDRIRAVPQRVIDADVGAPERIEVVDVEATSRAHEKLRQNYEKIWVFEPRARSKAAAQVDMCFDILLANKPETGTDVQKIADEIYAKAAIRLKNDDLNTLYRSSNLYQLHSHLDQIIGRTLSEKIIVSDKGFFNASRNSGQIKLANVPPEFQKLTQNEEPLGFPVDLRRHLSEVEVRGFYPSGEDRPLVEIVTKILMQVIHPNLEYDDKATKLDLADSHRSLDRLPIMRVYDAGSFIARRGQVVTATQCAAIERVDAIRARAYVYRFIGVVLLTLLCFAVVGVYMRRLRGVAPFTASGIALMCLPVFLALLIGRLLILLEVDPDIRWVLFPVSLIGMLSAVMIGPQAGFVLVLASGILFGVATRQTLDFHALALFGGLTSVLTLQSVRERKDVLAAGLRVSLVNVLTVWLLALFDHPSMPRLECLAWSLVNGLACAAATLVIMPIFEQIFGVVTDIRLLEITGPQHKLMRMLEEKAPGTYQHVLNVTKLAESAAEDIGANYLLVRSGAYFHDVGKMLKPKFFSENQVTLDDKKSHSRISPYMSTLIIKNHVKEGIELARKYGLPPKVIDFIPQHHGTSLIKYFYNEALQRYQDTQSTDVVREEDFRYPGPKPQTIEAAIVLLADSVEAISTAVFTQAQVNESDLRRTIAQAVSERFLDGQFDECDLTLRDLFLIRESFIRTLKARFHQRIAYPTLPRKETAPRELPTRRTGLPAPSGAQS